MNKYISSRYQEKPRSPLQAMGELRSSFDDIIDFSIGDPDMNTPEEIIRAAFKDAMDGHTKYTHTAGYPELRQEIGRFYKEEYGIDVPMEEIFVSTSACIAMYLAMEATLNDGDEVLIKAPYFAPYADQVKLARGVPVEVPSYEEDGFQIDEAALRAAVTPKTRAIIINSPCNPTGGVLSRESLEAIVRVAEESDLLIISDEIYTIYTYGMPFTSILEIPGARKRSIVLNSFSKNYIMTGWRLGNIIAQPEIISVIQQIHENLAYTAPSISQRAALYALRHRKEFQPAIFEEYKKRMYFAAERINAVHNMHVIYPPQGTFYLFPSIKDTGLDSLTVAMEILKQAHVCTVPGIAFGRCGEGHLRLAINVDIDTISEAFDRIEKMDMFRA